MNVFIDEVRTQGTVLHGCLNHYFGPGAGALQAIAEEFKAKKLRRVLFAGMGSSFYAPHCVTALLAANGIPATVLSGYEASRYNISQVGADTLVVCTTQSGKSWEVVELAEKAKAVTTVVGIYNREGSPISAHVHHHLLIHAGEERLISNKSYLCTLAVLNLLAHALTGGLDESFKTEALSVADWITGWLGEYTARTAPLMAFSEGTALYDFFADGPSLSTARQAALIYREGPKVYAAATETADYAHGWNKCAKPGYLGLLLSPGYESEAERRMVATVLEDGGKVLLLTAADIPCQSNLYVLKLPKVRPSLAPLLEIIPLNTLMGLILGEGWTR